MRGAAAAMPTCYLHQDECSFGEGNMFANWSSSSSQGEGEVNQPTAFFLVKSSNRLKPVFAELLKLLQPEASHGPAPSTSSSLLHLLNWAGGAAGASCSEPLSTKLESNQKRLSGEFCKYFYFYTFSHLEAPSAFLARAKVSLKPFLTSQD